ncbi:post-transcriptional regulator [Cytobacillus depressus]|uniref:Post-transcriptional regulator n=1 Tax=Cytobacillus depressus TaxID=1602942 RepID=A0A6L3VGR1_9BACI|nr:post-transcriptional regulator [Cytobacillus depressus]KAB2338684.1 post-transcriptional regulator [Cytobacillus depressus]
METSHTYDQFRNDLKPALQSKQEEFSLLGYGQVSEQELWNFLKRKKWKKTEGNKSMAELMQDILSVKVGEYFNYATVEAFKEAEFAFEDKEELRKLFE